MTRTKTNSEIQADYEAVEEEMSTLTTEQVKLQNKLMPLNLLYQVQKHGIARPYTTWFVPAIASKLSLSR
jgi:hypothetical protein